MPANHLVVIESPSAVNTLGAVQETWLTYSEAWAEFEWQTGREYFASAERQSVATGRIKVSPFIDGVTTRMRVRYGTRIFQIHAVIDEGEKRRKLVLMVRETPFNLAHLRNMTAVTEMGGIVFPPLPAFYHRPTSIEEMVDHTVARVLELFDIAVPGPHWEGT